MRVITDNGANYRARDFLRTALAVASRHQRTRPYTPRHNGKVERYNRTLAEELLYSRPWTSEAERAAAILLGCVATAFVFTLLVFLLLGTDPNAGLDLLGTEESAGRVALSTGGIALVVVLVVGPTLAFGLSWLLGPQQQLSRHLIAFGAAGLLVAQAARAGGARRGVRAAQARSARRAPRGRE